MSHDAPVRLRRLLLPLALLLLPALAACDGSATGSGPAGTEVAVVLNSVGRSLTVLPVDDPAAARTIGLGAQGSPVAVAARNGVAVVPMGVYPFALVVDLATERVIHTVALPEGSGATGVAFVNDSVALVTNPGRNSVVPIDVRRGTARLEIGVGLYPQTVVAAEGRVYVVNAMLENFAPTGPGTITVLDAALDSVDAIPLTGVNPAAAVAADGALYVVHSGSFGVDDGAISVVSLATEAETERVTGLGEFPGSAAVGGDGRVYVSDYSVGIYAWNPATRALELGPGNPLTPVGTPPVSAVGFDSQGRLWTVNPGDCTGAGAVTRSENGVMGVIVTTSVGVCPFDVAFTTIPEADEE